MKLRPTLLAAAAAALWCTSPMAQTVGQTNSPNPNKAQNSDMRTQGDMMYRADSMVGQTNSPNSNKVQNGAMPTQDGMWRQGYDAYRGAPTASSRDLPVGQSYSPNPNKAQNSDMRTQ